MAREWTDEEVQKEIADAIAIVREDRFESFVRGRLAANESEPNDPGTEPKSGKEPKTSPPPPKETVDPPAKKKRSSLFFGELDDEE